MRTKRITAKQNEIFKRHVVAWENNAWDKPMSDKFTSQGEIISFLKAELTSEAVWNWVVTENVSITSQLIMQDSFFNHLTGKAQKAIRDGFKKLLNNAGIK